MDTNTNQWTFDNFVGKTVLVRFAQGTASQTCVLNGIHQYGVILSSEQFNQRFYRWDAIEYIDLAAGQQAKSRVA